MKDRKFRRKLKYYMGLTYTICLIPWEEYDGSIEYESRCIELSGCGGGGKTIKKALKSLKEAMKLYLEVSIERGFKLPEPKIRR